MLLSQDHIAHIIKDLNYRGIVADEVRDELIDHVCSATEREMEKGTRFIDAYHTVLKSFGHTGGLRETQKQVIQIENSKPKDMLKNYFTVAFRNLRKHSFYSAINIVGLAVGVSACLVMLLFIADELAYDTYNAKADRIYRVEAEVKFGGNEFQMAYRPAPEAHTLIQDFPEVESAVRFRTVGSYLVKAAKENDNIKELNVAWADSTFFKIFSIPVLEGNPKTALREHNGMAISKKMAEKYFKGASALGQTLILDNKYQTVVTAVYQDIPAASHFHFDFIFSMTGDFPIAREARSTSFMNESFIEYILLREGTNPKALEAKLPTFIEKHMGPEVRQAFGPDFSFEKFRASGDKYNLSLRPVTDIHLYSNVRGDFEPNSSITYVYLLGLVAGFILIIGCINFMNLSTARSSTRAKEVGVRKVMGSLRSHLVRQFLTESFLVTTFSFLIAFGFAILLLPLFNSISQRQLQIPFGEPLFYLILLTACLAIGLLAGLYPSFFLSAFKPVQVLKGRMALGMKSGVIRSSLVVFQFVISIFLIIGAVTVNRQLDFIQSKKLGFEKDQIVIIHDAYALRPNNAQPFKDEVLKVNAIETGTISGYMPVENEWAWRNNHSFWKEANQPTTENMISSQLWSVDYDYIKTLKMNVIAGRDFARDFPSDNAAIILNETAVKRLGLGDNPIGQKISFYEGEVAPENIQTKTLIGIVQDFHFSSMKESITSLGLELGKSDGSICFRFKPGQANEVISSIEKVWKKLAPGQPFMYSFLDEDFEKMYRSEQRLGTIFSFFAVLAIVIACLGLFALTAFTVEQRTKEIGIRKVLGAPIQSIVFLLSHEFGKLILIAFVLATPLAWYAITWWLKSYTFKVEIGWVIYVLSGAVALVVALVTMSFQSIKAATTNPVNSLRSE